MQNHATYTSQQPGSNRYYILPIPHLTDNAGNVYIQESRWLVQFEKMLNEIFPAIKLPYPGNEPIYEAKRRTSQEAQAVLEKLKSDRPPSITIDGFSCRKISPDHMTELGIFLCRVFEGMSNSTNLEAFEIAKGKYPYLRDTQKRSHLGDAFKARVARLQNRIQTATRSLGPRRN